MSKPLAKALHTVTVVARVARRLQSAEFCREYPMHAALEALDALGYAPESIDTDGELFAACCAAVRKAGAA